MLYFLPSWKEVNANRTLAKWCHFCKATPGLPGRTPVLFLEAMLFNNSGGARISISYSIFDVPTNRLQTVSFQLAPLLLTKAGQTPWEGARPPHSAQHRVSLFSAPDGVRRARPLASLSFFHFIHHCSLCIILPGIKWFSPAQKWGRSSISRPLLISPLIGSGVNRASRAATLKWLCRAERLEHPCLCVKYQPARPAAQTANKHSSSNHVVLQGPGPCWYFIASLSLILQAGPGMQSNLFLIRGGGHLCQSVRVAWGDTSCPFFT